MLSRLRAIPVLLLLAVISALPGCMPKDTVRLVYSPVTPSVLPTPTAPRIAVVQFEDKRGKDEIGERRNGDKFMAGSSVTEWVSRSLADELSRLGPQVSYAPTMQLAQSAQPDFIITGAVEDVWVKESSPTTYSASVRLKFNMANRRGTVYAEGLAASQEKSGLPNSSLAETVLTETLRDVLGVGASKINEAARK